MYVYEAYLFITSVILTGVCDNVCCVAAAVENILSLVC